MFHNVRYVILIGLFLFGCSSAPQQEEGEEYALVLKEPLNKYELIAAIRTSIVANKYVAVGFWSPRRAQVRGDFVGLEDQAVIMSVHHLGRDNLLWKR